MNRQKADHKVTGNAVYLNYAALHKCWHLPNFQTLLRTRVMVCSNSITASISLLMKLTRPASRSRRRPANLIKSSHKHALTGMAPLALLTSMLASSLGALPPPPNDPDMLYDGYPRVSVGTGG